MRALRTWLVLGLVLLALPTPVAPAHSDTGAPRVLSIVHLGDSYSAGNGIGNHHGPAPCLRSSHNWGSLFASWANSRGVATSYQNRACSGGNIDDLFSPRALPKQSAKEVAADSIEEAQAKLDETDACSARAAGDDLLSVDYHLRESDGLSLWARKYTYECQLTVRAQTDFVGPQTDLVLLTAGGNELGFTDIIANCFGPRIPGALEGANGTRCREGVAATMAGLPEMLDRLKSQISRLITERMTGNPKSQVILLAYPLLSLDRPYHLPDGAVSYDAARGVRELGRAAIREQRRIIDELENDFPGRVKFIEEVADAFDGHEPDPRVFTRNKHRWINEFLETSGDHGQNGGISGPRSGSSTDWYHPNLAGHRRIAKLMQDPSNLTGARSATESPDSPAATLQGPYVGKIGENLMLDARASLPSRGGSPGSNGISTVTAPLTQPPATDTSCTTTRSRSAGTFGSGSRTNPVPRQQRPRCWTSPGTATPSPTSSTTALSTPTRCRTTSTATASGTPVRTPRPGESPRPWAATNRR